MPHSKVHFYGICMRAKSQPTTGTAALLYTLPNEAEPTMGTAALLYTSLHTRQRKQQARQHGSLQIAYTR